MVLIPYGTLTNAATVIVGGALGAALNSRMPESVRRIVFQGLGLGVLAIGLDMTLPLPAGPETLMVLFSVVLGGVAGRLLRLEERMERMGDTVKAMLRSDNSRFTEGLITAFLIFCVGPLTILGSFEEGLSGDHTLLMTKSVLDGFAALALAATYGMGVVVSVIPLLAYQLALTYLAFLLTGVFTEPVVALISVTGGLLIVGIGINLLDLKKIPVGDLLPALPCIVLLAVIFV